MSLFSLIIVLVVVGVLMFLINSYIPMEARIKQILNIAVLIFIAIWLLGQLLGMLPPSWNVRIG